MRRELTFAAEITDALRTGYGTTGGNMNPGAINTFIGIIAGIMTIITGSIAIWNYIKKQPVKSGKSEDEKKYPQPKPKPMLPIAGVQEFTNNDANYRDWLTHNPQGFVINTPRVMPSNNMILHKASCSHIKNFDARANGAFTEKEYVKICATEVVRLREWAKAHGRMDSSFSGECSVCKPALPIHTA